MNKYIGLLIVIFSTSVSAGGDHFPIMVTNIEVEESDFSFSAKSVKSERSWMDEECATIKVSGTYDALKWLGYKRPMSKVGHQSALIALHNAFTNSRKLYFGYIGNGLYKTSDCSYLSKGLLFENGNVYSIYQNI